MPRRPINGNGNGHGKQYSTSITRGLKASPPRGIPGPASMASAFLIDWIFQAMRQGASPERVRQTASGTDPKTGDALVTGGPYDRQEVDRALRHVFDRMLNPPWVEVEHARAAQRERLSQDLMVMRDHARKVMRGKEGQSNSAQGSVHSMYNAIRGHEDLLADLDGTKTPLQVAVSVDVDVRIKSAVMTLVADATADDILRFGREQLEYERLTGAPTRIDAEADGQ
jgi:hypothetical protein